MKYLMFIKHTEDYRNQKIPPGLMAAMGEFVTESMNNGTVIDTAGLKPTSQANRVRLEGGKITVTDGPFTEAKEVVGGYALVEVESRAAAIEFAKKFMDMHRVHWPSFDGECELRPLEGMG